METLAEAIAGQFSILYALHSNAEGSVDKLGSVERKLALRSPVILGSIPLPNLDDHRTGVHH